jgi:hypothetical protein
MPRRSPAARRREALRQPQKERRACRMKQPLSRARCAILNILHHHGADDSKCAAARRDVEIFIPSPADRFHAFF